MLIFILMFVKKKKNTKKIFCTLCLCLVTFYETCFSKKNPKKTQTKTYLLLLSAEKKSSSVAVMMTCSLTPGCAQTQRCVRIMHTLESHKKTLLCQRSNTDGDQQALPWLHEVSRCQTWPLLIRVTIKSMENRRRTTSPRGYARLVPEWLCIHTPDSDIYTSLHIHMPSRSHWLPR